MTIRIKTKDIEHAAAILSAGGTVVFPTETLYGLAARATDRAAVRAVYAIKQRPREKLLPVIVGSFAQAEKYFIFSRAERALAKKFWPGPLSIVLKARSRALAAAVGARVAVRYSASAAAASLALRAGAPITSTSANISGKPGCFTIAAVKKQLGGASARRQARAYPDLFLNGGTLKRSLPSTIVRVVRGRVVIIREGKIPAARIISHGA